MASDWKPINYGKRPYPQRPVEVKEPELIFRRDPGQSTVTSPTGYRFKKGKQSNYPDYPQHWRCTTSNCPGSIYVTGQWETDGQAQFMRGKLVREKHGQGRSHAPPYPPAIQPQAAQAANVPEAEDDEPHVAANVPEAEEDEPDVAANVPEAEEDEPDVAANVPEAEEDEPDVAANVPEAEDDEPDVAANVPEAEEDAAVEPILAQDLLDRTHQADDSIAAQNLLDRTHQADESASSAEESARRLNPEEAARNREEIRQMAREAPVRYFAGGDPNIAAPVVIERHGVRIEPRDAPSPREQFRAAAKDDNLEELQRIYADHPGLLQDYPDILHPAAQNNYVDVCQWLLLIGADPNFRTPNGWTALHLAARRANHEIVSLMIASRRALINSLANGKTPLHMAIKDSGSEDRERVLETIKVLLAAPGIDLEATSSAGDTALMLAQRRTDPEMTKMIETRLSSI
ncbi:ankyrin repeats (3 copies) domain-containing protein [Ditylenchus destructor]|nr:ankyrin repeats (3 copies) domain-containing protein [Ditylenchus destructor]